MARQIDVLDKADQQVRPTCTGAFTTAVGETRPCRRAAEHGTLCRSCFRDTHPLPKEPSHA